MSGTYLSEFGNNKFGFLVRFLTDVLSGIPSIVVGVVAYTLVVLPFTVNFFRTIASPPKSGDSLFFVIPLDIAHLFMLPIFLAALEFVSIRLAISFWSEGEVKQKILVYVLFLLCQSFAMTSVYYDIRLHNFHDELNVIETTNKNILVAKQQKILTLMNLVGEKTQQTKDSYSERSDQITQLDNQIAVNNGELKRIGNESSELNKGIGDILPNNSDTLQPIIDAKNNEIGERRKQRKVLSDERSRIQSDIKALETQRGNLLFETKENASTHSNSVNQIQDTIRMLSDDLSSFSQKISNVDFPNNEIEYISLNLFTFKSNFAFLIAVLFPITITGVGFIFRKQTLEGHDISSLNLENELNIISSYPPESQRTSSKPILAIVATYLIGLKASKTLSIKTSLFHLEDELTRRSIDELEQARNQINRSKLAQDAKKDLSEGITELINQQFSTNGEQKI